MAKKVVGQIKLQIPAGQANPAQPVGPALSQQGVNIMAFCKEFNAAKKEQGGMVIPVVITVYQDKSFTFITKSPPASALLKKAAGIASGSKTPNKEKVGKVTKKRSEEHTSELQSHSDLVCRLLLEKKKKKTRKKTKKKKKQKINENANRPHKTHHSPRSHNRR